MPPSPPLTHLPGAPAVCGWTCRTVQAFGGKTAAQLGYAPCGNMAEVVHRLGGKIERKAEESGIFLEVKASGKFTLFLSTPPSERRDRFAMAQALGHYILHTRLGETAPVLMGEGGTGRMEWEANWFAAGFLIPADDFLKRQDEGNASLAVAFGVSEAAVALRRQSLEEEEK